MNQAESKSLNRAARRRRVALMGTIIGGILITGLIIGILGPARGGPREEATAPPMEMPPMPVDAATAVQQSVVDVVRATGRVEAIQAVELRPDEQGRIVELMFVEGQYVEAGTPLIRIDDAILRAQAERAEAERDLARSQLDRVRRLRSENATAPADLERAEAAARSADATLALLELQIERTTVRAPFSGVIGQRFVSIGDYVTSATSLMTIQTMNPQHVVIDVPERYSTALRPRQTVEFSVAAQPERVFRAEVQFIDPVVQNDNRTIVVKATAPNPDAVLRPGMFVEAKLAIGLRAGAVVVPEDAVQPLRTGNVIWAMVDGMASRRVVQLGTRSSGMVEVLSGVQAGEQVVVGGVERMMEGMPIAGRGQTPGIDEMAGSEEQGVGEP